MSSIMDHNDTVRISFESLPSQERKAVTNTIQRLRRQGIYAMPSGLARRISATMRDHARAGDIQRVFYHWDAVWLDFNPTPLIATGWNKRAYLHETPAGGKRVVYRPFDMQGAYRMWRMEKKALERLDELGIPRIERRYHPTEWVADSPLLLGYAPIRSMAVETQDLLAVIMKHGNHRTIRDFETIVRQLNTHRVEIDDLHLGFARDGRVMIVDPPRRSSEME
jgi:hypothetical protein